MEKQIKKAVKKTTSIEEKIASYIGSFGMTLNGHKFFINLEVGEGDILPIGEEDFEFIDLFEGKMALMLEAAAKQKNQTDFLSFCKFFASRSPELGRIMSTYTDLLISENIQQVEDGKWAPLFAVSGEVGSKSNEFYTTDWLRRAKKLLNSDPIIRASKAIYFGRGFVNSGSINYDSDYIANRNSNRSNNLPSR